MLELRRKHSTKGKVLPLGHWACRWEYNNTVYIVPKYLSGECAECLWFDIEIYIYKNIQNFFPHNKDFPCRKMSCCTIMHYSTRWRSLRKGIRGMETELRGFGRKVLSRFFVPKNRPMYVQMPEHPLFCRHCAECSPPACSAPLRTCVKREGWHRWAFFRSSRDRFVLPYWCVCWS